MSMLDALSTQVIDRKTSKMAIPQSGSELPNLKIEIENDLDDAMETDDGENNGDDKASKGEDPEEGEISDSKEVDSGKNAVSRSTFGPSNVDASIEEWGRRYKNKGGEFVTGEGIFTKEDQSKLDERAKRFGLEPSNLKPVTEVQLKTLYQSLGVPHEEGTEKHHRLNALHMRGTENMSTQDIFKYFKDYGPASIEWINDYSCNIVWLDNVSAARAMLGLSKEIKGLKDFHANADPFLKEKESDKENEKEDSVMAVEGESDAIVESNKTSSEKSHAEMIVDNDAVDVSDIPIPIPPGKWRVGAPFPEAKCILLRFATRSDKKQPQAEKMSEYYKKYGNPNYGGIKGLITNSRKRRYRQHNFNSKVFDDDQGDARDFKEATPEDGKNPWGNLAKSWSKLDRKHGHTRPEPNDRGSPPPIKKEPDTEEPQGRSVFDRIKTGAVRASTPSESDASSSESSTSNTSNESTEWTRKSKVPRMRMYADEEAIRIERRRARVQEQSRRKHSRERRRESRSSERRRRNDSYRSKESRGWRSSRYSEERESRSRSDLRSRLGKGGRATTSSTVWDRLKKTSSWERDGSSSGEETAPSKFDGGDLRTKLNLKKTMRKHNLPMQKSPLRIEIDNDEYYKLIGSDQE